MNDIILIGDDVVPTFIVATILQLQTNRLLAQQPLDAQVLIL